MERERRGLSVAANTDCNSVQTGVMLSESRPNKEKIEGARRVWGTISMCTTGTVQNTIKKLCSVNSVQVRRKMREMPNGKLCWWFVLHDNEAMLQEIDKKWEQVSLQTMWKLEPCFRTVTTSISHPLHTTQDGAINPTIVTTVTTIPEPSPPALSAQASVASGDDFLTSVTDSSTTVNNVLTPVNNVLRL